MEYRNYLNIFNSNYNFADLGYADGYADLPSDEKTILSQLYGKIKEEELVYSLDMYLQGYDLGSWLSQNADTIYDEDGNLYDNINLDTLSYKTQAKQLIINYIKSDTKKY